MGHAQSIAAGTVSLGSGIGYNRNTSSNDIKIGNAVYTAKITDSQFRVSASTGYFIADNLAVGLNTNYRAGRVFLDNAVPGSISPKPLDASTAFSVGPYVQYYKLLTDQFGIVGTLGAGYQSSFSPSYIDPAYSIVSEIKGRGYYAGITPSIVFFPILRLGISASMGQLGFDKFTNKREGNPDELASSQSSFRANFGLDQLQFGGTYYFGRE